MAVARRIAGGGSGRRLNQAENQAEGEAVHEEIDLFGGPELVFGCRHEPATAAAAGVVVCLGAPFDGGVDDGRSARLGRRLAAAGIAVQRFRYRGAWPSDGDVGAHGFAGLVEDARRALDLLVDRTGVRQVAIVGARLGSLVAARLARDLPGAPLVLWAPVPHGRSALEQAARGRAARRAREAPWGPPGADPLVEPAAGWAPPARLGPAPADDPEPGPDATAPLVDLFDTPVAADLAGPAIGRLEDELGPGPRAVLVVDTSDGDGADEREALVAGCRAGGLAVDVAKHPCDGELDGRAVPAASPDALVDDTASWLVARLLAPGAATSGGNGWPEADA